MIGGSATAAGARWMEPAALCFVAGLAAAVDSSPAQVPSAPFRFRTEVRTVLVPVSVEDASGRPVTGLPVSAFTVLDQGEERPIVFFDEGDEPLSTVLVLDVSSSMRGERLSDAKRAAQTFVERIERDVGNAGYEGDARSGEAALIAFDDRVRIALPWVADPQRVLRDIDAVEAGGGTALYDAIETALDLVESARNRRRVIVVLSDGKDEDSSQSFAALRKRVEASEASLFAVGFYTAEERRLFTPGRRYFKEPAFEVNLNPTWVLAELAAATGGVALFPSNGQDLAPVFESIAAELRHQYLLGFEPDSEVRDDSGFRKIEILVSSTEHVGPLRVRGRQGYAPGGGGVSEDRSGSGADVVFEVSDSAF
jgi:Ca-activated chloride channel family protein